MGWAIRSSVISTVQLKIFPLREKLRSGVTTRPTPIVPEAALPGAQSPLSIPRRNLYHDGCLLGFFHWRLPHAAPQHGSLLSLSLPLGFHCLGLWTLLSSPLLEQVPSFSELLGTRFPKSALERKQPEAGGFLKIHCYFLVAG